MSGQTPLALMPVYDCLGRRDRDARSLRCWQNDNGQAAIGSPRIAASVSTL